MLLVVSLVAAACTGAPTERIPGVRPGIAVPSPESRTAAPTEARPILGGDGETISLAGFAGQVVVLNFWGSWCGPCRAEQPDLNEAYRTLRDLDVAFLGVDIQEPSETNGLAHEREFSIPYPSIYDPSNEYASLFRGVGPRSVPTTILIDRQGRVAVSLFGLTNTTEVVVLAEMLASETDGTTASPTALPSVTNPG